MLQYLRNENPEINSILLDLAQQSLDPKMVIQAGYKVYRALELAFESEKRTSP